MYRYVATCFILLSVSYDGTFEIKMMSTLHFIIHGYEMGIAICIIVRMLTGVDTAEPVVMLMTAADPQRS